MRFRTKSLLLLIAVVAIGLSVWTEYRRYHWRREIPVDSSAAVTSIKVSFDKERIALGKESADESWDWLVDYIVGSPEVFVHLDPRRWHPFSGHSQSTLNTLKIGYQFERASEISEIRSRLEALLENRGEEVRQDLIMTAHASTVLGSSAGIDWAVRELSRLDGLRMRQGLMSAAFSNHFGSVRPSPEVMELLQTFFGKTECHAAFATQMSELYGITENRDAILELANRTQDAALRHYGIAVAAKLGGGFEELIDAIGGGVDFADSPILQEALFQYDRGSEKQIKQIELLCRRNDCLEELEESREFKALRHELNKFRKPRANVNFLNLTFSRNYWSIHPSGTKNVSLSRFERVSNELLCRNMILDRWRMEQLDRDLRIYLMLSLCEDLLPNHGVELTGSMIPDGGAGTAIATAKQVYSYPGDNLTGSEDFELINHILGRQGVKERLILTNSELVFGPIDLITEHIGVIQRIKFAPESARYLDPDYQETLDKKW